MELLLTEVPERTSMFAGIHVAKKSEDIFMISRMCPYKNLAYQYVEDPGQYPCFMGIYLSTSVSMLRAQCA